MDAREVIARALAEAKLPGGDGLQVLLHASEYVRGDHPVTQQLEDTRNLCRGFADAILAALRAAGMEVVPREPTPEMKQRVANNGGPQALAWAMAAWPDMLAAAAKEE